MGDLFLHMPKVNDSPKKSLKINTTQNERDVTMKPRNKQIETTSSRLNVGEGIQTAQSQSHPSHARSEDIQPTPSLTRNDPSVQDPSHEEDIPVEDLMSSISPDQDGLLTVIHNVFTRTMEQYEETLTSLFEVVSMTNLKHTIISNSEIMFAHSEYHHPSRGVTEFIFEEI